MDIPAQSLLKVLTHPQKINQSREALPVIHPALVTHPVLVTLPEVQVIHQGTLREAQDIQRSLEIHLALPVIHQNLEVHLEVALGIPPSLDILLEVLATQHSQNILRGVPLVIRPSQDTLREALLDIRQDPVTHRAAVLVTQQAQAVIPVVLILLLIPRDIRRVLVIPVVLILLPVLEDTHPVLVILVLRQMKRA